MAAPGNPLDELNEADVQDTDMTINLIPRKCLGYRSPVEAILSELGRDVQIRFALAVALSDGIYPRLKL